MNESMDCVVVGAGVVGLAVARALAMSGREVAVLEAEPDIGMHTSSRNSEVIHAGIYYARGSLKANFCVRGKELLYRYCNARNVPHKAIGKLIVAVDESEVEKLQGIKIRASQNQVADLVLLDRAEAMRQEPGIRCEAALYSPSTGIIDSHSLMQSLQADIEAHGGSVVTRSRVETVDVLANGFSVQIAGSDEPVMCRSLVNSAGLWAETVAGSIQGLPREFVRKTSLAKGHYYSYSGRSPFGHLVYPLPVDGGLGVHATIDMSGGVRFGPDVEWIDEIDYQFNVDRRKQFAESIRRYFPGVEGDRLMPSYTGIRPKLSASGMPAVDFAIDGVAQHGVPELVNLFGIESPGLTASLAIAEHVETLLRS